jgi:hypothetical protein
VRQARTQFEVSGTVQHRGTAIPIALALALASVEPVRAGPFDRSPRQYDAPVNRVLQQVGSDFRLQLERCDPSPRFRCRFSSPHVAALVWGRADPPHIEKITLSADLFRDDTTTDPLAAVTDLVLVFGATVVIFDPYLPPDRRVQLLSDTIELALTTGASEEVGREAHFALLFDEAADGLFVIVITPKA